ncbi:MAG: hypothetical protein NTU51_01420 [Bacteroidetes bacterium]|nr:hypothetical protein [Bacteroidota bacterium]
MKKVFLFACIPGIIALMLVISCSSPISLTSWKNPDDHNQVSKVVVIPIFSKLEYVKPFEYSMCGYFKQMGLKSIGSLDFLNPTKSYTVEQVKNKIDSLGADAVLIFKYSGTDKESTYVPATYYGGYGSYWGWGGGFYGGGVYSGGYWSTTSTVNLKSILYNVKNTQSALWTADISVTDPQYIDQSALQLAQKIYADWLSNGLIMPAAKK